ncbi:hypothetical protein SJ675_11615, partial [Enterococcus faecium]
WLKTLYRKRAVTWPFIFYTIIWTLSIFRILKNKFDYLREYIEIKFLNYIISYEHSLRCHAMNGSYFIEKEWF